MTYRHGLTLALVLLTAPPVRAQSSDAPTALRYEVGVGISPFSSLESRFFLRVQYRARLHPMLGDLRIGVGVRFWADSADTRSLPTVLGPRERYAESPGLCSVAGAR